MALQEGYATVEYADIVNTGLVTWTALTTAQKEYALSISRFYIDSEYTCSTFTEPYPDELMTANSMLASDYADGTLFQVEDAGAILIAKTVKAGDVSSSKEYAGRYMSGLVTKVDRFPEVTALISSYCSYGSGSKTLTRV